MINVGVVGLGKMGLSHLSLFNAHPEVNVVAICDSTGYMLSVLGKYTGLRTYSDYTAMLGHPDIEAVVISTPSVLHTPMVRAALERGLHVFCEKPFCLDPVDSAELTAVAQAQGVVTQVGYHYRHVGAFQEVKRLLDAGTIGTVSHVLAEAYGPVVLKPQGSTWRSTKGQGGGSLYDYAAHPLNLLNWYFGEALQARGSVLNSVFSRETDDEVFSTLSFAGGSTAQLSVSWSDESQRKMSTKVTIWGSQGRIFADRQEVQVYLREGAAKPEGYTDGWNVRYTTDLTEEVWFYLRGEEYSAQVDGFVRRIRESDVDGVNCFASAAQTDRTIQLLIDDATRVAEIPSGHVEASRRPSAAVRTLWRRRPFSQRRPFSRLRARLTRRTVSSS